MVAAYGPGRMWFLTRLECADMVEQCIYLLCCQPRRNPETSISNTHAQHKTQSVDILVYQRRVRIWYPRTGLEPGCSLGWDILHLATSGISLAWMSTQIAVRGVLEDSLRIAQTLSCGGFLLVHPSSLKKWLHVSGRRCQCLNCPASYSEASSRRTLFAERGDQLLCVSLGLEGRSSASGHGIPDAPWPPVVRIMVDAIERLE